MILPRYYKVICFQNSFANTLKIFINLIDESLSLEYIEQIIFLTQSFKNVCACLKDF